MNRRLLYVSNAGASTALWRRGRIQEVQGLDGDQEGWEQFNALLLRAPRSPVWIVVDSVEEFYRSETLPRAFGPDRREMTGRRLRQILHQTPYRAVLKDGRAGDRTGDRYLFMGLTAPDILRPWLDVLKLRGTPLAGIWLAPVLSQSLLARFNLTERQLLLVSEQTGGLRLSFFEDGLLRFSRLAPVDSALYDDPLKGYGDEIERTRQFLQSQRLLGREDRLKVYLFDPLNTLAELGRQLTEASAFLCEPIDRNRILNEGKLPPSLLSESSDALFLAMLVGAPRAANLLPPEPRREFLHYRLSRWLYGGSALALGGALLLSLLLTADAWRQSGAAEAFRNRIRASEAQMQEVLVREGLADRFDQVRAALDAWRQVERHHGDPAAALARVRAVTQGHAGIHLSRIDWQAPEPGSSEHLALEGEIVPFDGDYRAAHTQVAAFMDALSQAGWQVRAERWPLDPSTEQELQGEFGQGQGRLQARFGLTLNGHGSPVTTKGESSAP